MTTGLDSSFFEFWIWTNHNNSLLSLATNQFASFCIGIRSHKCYFRVCQMHFFPYILIFYYIKQIDSMLPCVCSVIDHRGRQNVVRTSVTHSAAPRVPLFCSYHILTSLLHNTKMTYFLWPWMPVHFNSCRTLLLLDIKLSWDCSCIIYMPHAVSHHLLEQ